MAPTSKASKLVQHNRPQQAAPKAIVPAIPLPFIQKKKPQLVAREHAKEETVQKQIVEPEPEPTLRIAEVVPTVVNGSLHEQTVNKVVESDKVLEVEESANKPAVFAAPAVEEVVEGVEDTANEEQDVQEAPIREVAEEKVKPCKYIDYYVLYYIC